MLALYANWVIVTLLAYNFQLKILMFLKKRKRNTLKSYIWNNIFASNDRGVYIEGGHINGGWGGFNMGF